MNAATTTKSADELAAELISGARPDPGPNGTINRLDAEIERERNRRTARRIVDHEEVPPAPIPAVQSLSDRLAVPVRPLVWRIKGVMQASHRALLSAQAKAGKTTTVVNVVRALVDGSPLFGRFAVKRVDLVTVLDFEMADDDPGQLDDWFRDAKLTHPDRVQIVPLRGRASAFNILDPRIRGEWADLLRGSDVVVWDCVSTVVMALALDENLDAQRLLVAFDELLKAAGVRDAIVVQHMGHNNERARGSSGFLAWPDVLWTLVRDERGKRFFRAEGRGVDVAESELSFDPAKCALRISGGSRRASLEFAALDEIVKVIKASEAKAAEAGEAQKPLSGRNLKDATAGVLGRDRVDAALAHGVKLGVLVCTRGARNANHYTVGDESKLRRPDVDDEPF